MILREPHSWVVSWDVPLLPNFALYTREACGLVDVRGLFDARSAWPAPFLAPLLDAAERDQAGREWQAWWNRMTDDLCRYHAYHRGAPGSRREPAVPPPLPDGPGFSSLSACPTLQRACRLAWSHFQSWWNHPAGGHVALTGRLREVLSYERGALPRQIVRDAERYLRRRIRPFWLDVGIVYVDGLRPVAVGDTYVLVPAGLLYRTDDLREWLTERVAAIG